MEIQTNNPTEGYPFPCFSFDENRTVILNTGYILCSNSIDVRYILGVLNSDLGGFLAKLYVTQLQERQFRMLAQYVSKFPIPKASDIERKELIELVKHQISQYSLSVETNINELIYGLFGLDDNEKDFIRISRS